MSATVRRLRREAGRARARTRAAVSPAAQAALAAGLAWYVAHDLLGHAQPFFAPIAALVAVSTANVQRSQRTLQMATGVLLGIAVGEAFTSFLGVTALTIGIVAFVTLLLAVAIGVGILGQGMMFVNQAGASAVLVVALHHTGTAGERLLDAVVGGAMAILVAVVAFPVEPLGLVRNAERELLQTLARTLSELDELYAQKRPPSTAWVLSRSRTLNQSIGRLSQARRDAQRATRVAPRRRRLRGAVEQENARTRNVDLLANTTLNLLRVAADGLALGEPVLDRTHASIAGLAHAVGGLAQTRQPWPADLVVATRDEASRAIAGIEEHAAPRAPLVASLVRETGRDLLLVLPGAPLT